MSFYLNIPKNTTSSYFAPKSTSLVTTKGTLYRYSVSTGLIELADNTTTTAAKLVIANETIAAADARATVHVTEVTLPSDKILADTVNNTNTTHNGQKMILGATGVTVNNTGTDSASGVFRQIAPVGSASDKKAYFELVS